MENKKFEVGAFNVTTFLDNVADLIPQVEILPKNNPFKPIKKEINTQEILELLHSEFCNQFIDEPWIYEILKERSYFAGGCIRDLETGNIPKDWDLFICDKIESIEVLKYFKNKDAEFEKQEGNKKFAARIFNFSKNDNVNYFFNKTENIRKSNVFISHVGCFLIQIITVQSGSPKEIINRFDFKHNTGYYWPATKEINIPEEIETKELKIMPDTLFPVNAFIRLARFIQEGYTITPEEIVKLAILVQQRPSLLDKENLTKETFGLSFNFGEQ